MKKISSKEIFTFCFCLGTFLFPGFAYDMILEHTKNSSFIASIIGFILGFIPVLILIYMNKNLKDKNIFEFNKEKLKIFGKILNIIIIICVVLICLVSSWIMINFVISQFLTRNSYYTLGIVFFLIIAYNVSKDLEVMGRTNIVLTVIFLITMILSWFSLIPEVEINNLYPLLYTNPIRFIKSNLTYILLSHHHNHSIINLFLFLYLIFYFFIIIIHFRKFFITISIFLFKTIL